MASLVLIPNTTAFAANKKPANILVLGDSLSGAYGINVNEGWVALLQQQLNDKGYEYNVVNASVSGDTTRTGLTRADNAITTHQPEVVIIALGGNDGLRGLPFSEIEKSLSNIIQLCQKENIKTLLVAVRLPPNYGAAYLQNFAQIYRSLSTRFNIPLVPQMLKQVAERRELIQEDGIHPTAKAQPQIMENIWAELKLLLATY